MEGTDSRFLSNEQAVFSHVMLFRRLFVKMQSENEPQLLRVQRCYNLKGSESLTLVGAEMTLVIVILFHQPFRIHHIWKYVSVERLKVGMGRGRCSKKHLG